MGFEGGEVGDVIQNLTSPAFRFPKVGIPGNNRVGNIEKEKCIALGRLSEKEKVLESSISCFTLNFPLTLSIFFSLL